MTGDAGAGARESSDRTTEDGGQNDYDEMLDALDAAIGEARAKVESGRVYNAEHEKVRVKWIRALAYAVNVRRQVTTDRDLEELAERLDALEEDAQSEGPGVKP